MGELRTVAATIGLAAVPWLLVFIQPDIGTSLVYLAGLAAVLFIAGTRWLHLAAARRDHSRSCRLRSCGRCRRPASTC